MDYLVIATVLGPLVGAVIAVLAAPVGHRLFGPRLCPDFKPDDGRRVVDLPESTDLDSPQCRWARVSVINCGRSHLRNCQGFVSNIEQEQSGKRVKTTPQFVDPLILE